MRIRDLGKAFATTCDNVTEPPKELSGLGYEHDESDGQLVFRCANWRFLHKCNTNR